MSDSGWGSSWQVREAGLIPIRSHDFDFWGPDFDSVRFDEMVRMPGRGSPPTVAVVACKSLFIRGVRYM